MTTDTADHVLETAAVSARVQLRQEILALTDPHQSATRQPPFSAGELIVMALVCKDTESLKAPGIMRWIVKHFRYYGERAMEEYTRHVEVSYERREQLRVVVAGFSAALNHYELPFTRTSESMYSLDYTYSIETAAARLYLRGYLTKRPAGAFPFLRLPPELRNHIYELNFYYAEGPGLAVDDIESGGLSMLVQHPGDDSYATDWWGYNSAGGNKTLAAGEKDVRKLPPINEVMSLLLVCKQVSGEALPYFYQLNRLHINTFEKLTALAHRMSPSRLEHLNHLSIELYGCCSYNGDVSSFSKFPQTMKALKAIKDLKKLEVETTDKMWLSMRPVNRQALGRKRPFKKFATIPGMKAFAELAESAGSFNLWGEAPQLKNYLDSQMQLIKAARDKQEEVQGADSGKGKKRKATGESTDGPSGGKKRARRAKKGSGSQQDGDDA